MPAILATTTSAIVVFPCPAAGGVVLDGGPASVVRSGAPVVCDMPLYPSWLVLWRVPHRPSVAAPRLPIAPASALLAERTTGRRVRAACVRSNSHAIHAIASRVATIASAYGDSSGCRTP